jgi:hypothetical protein
MAGRKPLNKSGPMRQYKVRLTAKEARQARKLGKGNLSAGIREALAACR